MKIILTLLTTYIIINIFLTMFMILCADNKNDIIKAQHDVNAPEDMIKNGEYIMDELNGTNIKHKIQIILLSLLTVLPATIYAIIVTIKNNK